MIACVIMQMATVVKFNGKFLLEDKMKDSFKKLVKFISLLGSLAVAVVCMLTLLGPAIENTINPTMTAQ